jgi:hypothetical protein
LLIALRIEVPRDNKVQGPGRPKGRGNNKYKNRMKKREGRRRKEKGAKAIVKQNGTGERVFHLA